MGVYQEDIHHQGVVGAPLYNGVHTIHPPKNASVFTKIWATRDMVYEHHWEVKNALLYGLKGALAGALVASYVYTRSQVIPSFVLKKLMRYTRNTTFGHSHMMAQMVFPYAATGFGVGASYYIYNYTFCSEHTLQYDIISNAIFGQVATALCVNPAVHHYGLFAGIIYGMFRHLLYESNAGVNKQTAGFYSHIGQKSDEERERQKHQDFIASFVLFNDVRDQNLIDL